MTRTEKHIVRHIAGPKRSVSVVRYQSFALVEPTGKSLDDGFAFDNLADFRTEQFTLNGNTMRETAMSLNRKSRFISTLARLVELGPRLQNAPNANLVPEESLACAVVEQLLHPLHESGFLTMRRDRASGMESRPSLGL